MTSTQEPFEIWNGRSRIRWGIPTFSRLTGSEVCFRGEHFCSEPKAKQRADWMFPFQEVSMSYQDWLPQCAICKESITLEESKTDQRGQAVHENCYVWTFALRKPRRHVVGTGVVPEKSAVNWPLRSCS